MVALRVIVDDVVENVETSRAARIVDGRDADATVAAYREAGVVLHPDADDPVGGGLLGEDRAHAFSWRDTAERIWQLHAEL